MKENNVEKLDFSIVVCCYFGEKTIVRCLDSLINQKYSNSDYEIIIVDDGSIDNSTIVIRVFLESLSKDKPLIKYFRTENNGLSKARNFGIDKSDGKYVLFIDEDARACTDWLHEYNSTIMNNDYPDVVYGLVKPFDSANWFEKFITNTFYDKFDKDGNQIPVLIGTNMGYKKQLFHDGDGFFDDYTYRGDENIFIMSLAKPFSELSNIDAFVCHENPNQFINWLRERFQNGEAEYIIDKFKVKFLKLEKNNFILKKIVKKIFIILILFILFLLEINLFYTSIILLSSIYFFVRKDMKIRRAHLIDSGYNLIYLNLFLSIILRISGFFIKELGYAKRLIMNELFSPNRGNFADKIVEQIIIDK